MSGIQESVVEVQRALALEAAVSDIEALVPRVRLGRVGRPPVECFDLSAVEAEEKGDVARAVFYLSAMQRLQRNPRKPHLVTILSAANS